MSNRFFFGGSDDSDSGEDNLPFPKPLSRAAFLTPDFDPATYLSSLRNRHQTLEDLRTELRTRSQDISKELLDLVNDNYQDFLSLGGSLQGGDEKVEEVRLGLLGFKREIEGLRAKLDERRKEVDDLVARRKAVRRQLQLGRALCKIDYRLHELEQSLMITPDEAMQNKDAGNDHQEINEGDEDSDDSQEGNGSTSGLIRHVRQYLLTRREMERMGPHNKFIVQNQARLKKVKDTILLDLGNALKQTSGRDDQQLITLLAAYRDLDASHEAVQVLKERLS
ncbi:MAG: hypothetical protein LQ344_003564 [Seirophora lacunosa]|nr:MAG: hypothetical protein LQ344_003564 [Seirophora lacunosa]